MPWKNGGGTTRELWKWPHPSDPARFLARVSIATVAAPGPFSVFPGIDRILVLLEGQGVVLLRADAPRVVLDRRGQSIAFPGEAPIDCELLGGPVRDFNLMVDRAALEGSLEVVRLEAGTSRRLEGEDTVLLHALEGQTLVSGAPLATDETLWWERAPASLELHGEAGGSMLVAVRLRAR